MISFCVTSKDRYSLFVKCIQSLCASIPEGLQSELIVADWGSTDRTITRWLPKLTAGTSIDLTCCIINRKRTFSRGYGLNLAARYARYPVLFFIDTDMLFYANIIHDAVKYTDRDIAYFPICWSYTKPDHSAGRWRVNGKGITAVTRKTYIKAGKWDEFEQWGSEDKLFYNRVQKITKIERTNKKGLYHQWHPPSMTPNTVR